MIQRLGQDRRAEDEEGQQHQELALSLGEFEEEAAPLPHLVAEGHARDEGGDEAIAADQFRAGEGDERHRQDRRTLVALGHPIGLDGAVDQSCRDRADDHPGERPEGDLHRPEEDPVAVAGLAMGQRRKAGEQQHERQGDAVVQPAFDVERLANARRDEPAGHHGLAERRIRRRQDRRQQGGLPQAEAQRQAQPNGGAQGDGQGHADQQHPERQVVVPAHDTQVDPRGVGKQHQDQRDFGQSVDEPVVEVQIGGAQHGAADDEAQGGKDHRSGQHRCLQPPRGQAEEDHAGGDDHKSLGVHALATPRLGRAAPADIRSSHDRRR